MYAQPLRSHCLCCCLRPQAHATANAVVCYYVATSPSAAAFVTEWDQWRDAGVRFNPLYTEAAMEVATPDSPMSAALSGDSGESSSSAGGVASNEQVLAMLDSALFVRANGLQGALGARPADATVVLAGVSGTLASSIANELSFKGVARERLLFCDFF